MDIQTWVTINKYYQAVWEHFSVSKLDEVFDDEIELFHESRNESSKGKNDALNTYKKHFFDSCLLKSTELYDFRVQPHLDLGKISVSYTIRQFNELRGDGFGHCNEWFELTEDNKKIKKLTMVSSFLGPKGKDEEHPYRINI